MLQVLNSQTNSSFLLSARPLVVPDQLPSPVPEDPQPSSPHHPAPPRRARPHFASRVEPGESRGLPLEALGPASRRLLPVFPLVAKATEDGFQRC